MKHPPRWTVMVAALLATMLVGARPTGHAAAIEPSLLPNANVATDALRYNGTYQGECWGFVKKVVLEATGNQMGFDYRQGFFDGGAIEVTLAQAQTGDVIQFADDANTSPTADYPGLHTAIILQQVSPGIFNIIDSNSEWDGIVRVRTNYSPVAESQIKGLAFHIYRFPGGGAAPAQPATTSVSTTTASTTLAAGQTPATVNTPNDCLNLRATPDVGATIIACMPDQTALGVITTQADSTGRVWANVVTPWGTGWSAADYLIISAPQATTADASTDSSSTGSTSS